MKLMVFSGGAGTRMWPLSRKAAPKQFQKLVGETTFIQDMVQLVLRGFPAEDIFVLTGEDYIQAVQDQVPEIPPENIIGEPDMRDTLAAVGFACAFLEKKFPGETMAALWGADQIVKEKETFIDALKAAEKLAIEKGVIAKVDVHPTFPSPHLGYIEIGEKIDEVDGFDVYEFLRHVEKPNYETAQKFLESGKYLWNTGYFVWKLDTIMGLFEKYNNQAYKHFRTIQAALGTEKEKEVINQEYQKIEKQSIDYGLFEKLGKADQLEIPAVLGWTDVGAWNVLKDELSEALEHNVVRGEHVDIDSKDCLIYETQEGKVVATVGLEGMIIVDTNDALLICPKDRSQDVKKIVAKLKADEKSHLL